MVKAFMQGVSKLSQSLFINMDFKNRDEFYRQYTLISLQRGKLFKWLTVFVGIYSLYFDFLLSRSDSIDLLYRQNLVLIHLVVLVLSPIYILIYHALQASETYRVSWVSKAVILSDLFLSLLIGALLSLNSQRFTGNVDAYLMVVLVAALAVPMYPKWVTGIYCFVHAFFLIVLSTYHQNNIAMLKQFNATNIVLVALVLFFVLYKYHVNSFLNQERLKEDKATFLQLFEINPFPLMICSFEDGHIQYANHRATLFYGVNKEQIALLNHKDLYTSQSDVNIIYELLKTNGAVDNYVVEQKTQLGETKCPIVNYKLIDFLGEKSILIGVSDIAEIKRMEHELAVYASTDVLTGTYNRRVGMDLIRKRYDRANRQNEGFTLCFIDLDHLKMVNDQYGHLEGDSFIVDVCRIIKEEITHNDIIFRYGGDEFMVLFDQDDAEEIKQICHRFTQRFEALNKNHYKAYTISASIGLFSYKPEMNLTPEQIIECVDRNMYQHKLAQNGGGNQTVPI